MGLISLEDEVLITCSELVVPYSMKGTENEFYIVGSDEKNVVQIIWWTYH
jgi:hypothetical protein